MNRRKFLTLAGSSLLVPVAHAGLSQVMMGAAKRRTPASSFDPTLYGTVQGWYKSGYYSAGTGTWSDFYGSLDLLQADTTKQPTVSSALINGRDAATFDGVNDFIQAASSTSASSVFILCQLTVQSSSQATYGTIYINNQASGRVCARLNGSNWGSYTGSGNLDSGENLSASTNYLLSMRSNLSSCTIYRDGTQKATAATNGSGNTTSLITIGSESSTIRFAKVSISDILVYSTVVSTGANLDAIHTYFKGLGGIA